MTRPAIPAAIKRKLYEEAGYRCAIPTCRSTSVLQMAHIIERSIVQEDTFENMIILCVMCHGLYDVEKKIPKASILVYKANLGLLNSRFSQSETRLLEYFAEDPDDNVLLTAMDPMFFMNLINDGHLECHPGDAMQISYVVNGTEHSMPTSWIYILTDSGKELVDQMLEATIIE